MIEVNQVCSNRLLSDVPPEWVLFGKSLAMQDLKHKLVRVCSTSVSVLLQGEVGVGKSLLSRFIHKYSPGLEGPYMRVNCSALSSSLDCLDLFALPKLSRTHCSCCEATENRSPHSGTLFFDQVSDLNPRLQYQVTNALAERDLAKMSHQCSEGKGVRIISANIRSLREEVKLGRFRRELFYRLAVVTIDVPPLRNRVEDIPDLIEYFRLRYTAKLNVTNTPFPADLRSRALSYRWPGNIRELESFVRRFVLLGYDRCTFGEADSAIGCSREWESRCCGSGAFRTKGQPGN